MFLKGVMITSTVLALGIIKRNKDFRTDIANMSGAQLELFKYHLEIYLFQIT